MQPIYHVIFKYNLENCKVMWNQIYVMSCSIINICFIWISYAKFLLKYVYVTLLGGYNWKWCLSLGFSLILQGESAMSCGINKYWSRKNGQLFWQESISRSHKPAHVIQFTLWAKIWVLNMKYLHIKGPILEPFLFSARSWSAKSH